MRNNNYIIGRLKRKKVATTIAIAMTLLIFLANFWILYTTSFSSDVVYLKQFASIIGMVFAGLLYVGCGINYELDTRMGKFFATISILLFSGMTVSLVLDTYAGNPEMKTFLFVFETIITFVSIGIHIMFWFYQVESLPSDSRQKKFTVWILVLSGVYILLNIINIFKPGLIFYVDASGYFVWSGLPYEVAVLGLYYVTYLVYILPQNCSMKKKLSLASFAIIPLGSIVLSIIWYFTDNNVTIASSTGMMLLFAAYTVFLCDYRDTQEELLQQKAEIADSERSQIELQTALMLSQIRPHFLYNSLTAIRNLTKTDPEAAYNAIGNFADYLRANMDSIGEGRMIPFDKELEHIKTYLMLEQLRFGDDLKVEYDIQYTDFSLPALAVQPIVENAVKYGATMNEEGGLVRIATALTDDGVCITVSDNGPGFDPFAPMDDGRNHFGIQNVRNSLSTRNCGELVIASDPGKGTTATIVIRGELSNEYLTC